MSRYIIKHIRLAHCKRGPARCAKCREMDVGKWCLLDIEPPDAGMAQRRVIQITLDGQETWREFDVAQVFESEADARAYACENSIDIQTE